MNDRHLLKKRCVGRTLRLLEFYVNISLCHVAHEYTLTVYRFTHYP
jgi:hypothetical protein